ncbi:MAG: NADPH-dependent FMN reductase [Sphingomicrobium sp.]
MEQHKIAVVVGSLRAGSLNRKLAKAFCGLASGELDCKIAEIGDLPLYNEDIDKQPPQSWTRFREEIKAADGVLFVTPEYNRSMPGGLKNAIDVGSRPYGGSAFAKKPAGVVTASPGGIGGFGCNHALRQCCVFLDMPVMQQPEAYFGGVTDAKFGPDGAIVDDGLRKIATGFAHAFADWVRTIKLARAARAPDPTGAGA